MSLLQSIKNLLKYFLPPPVHAFNREVARILDAVEQDRRETEALQRLFASQSEHLELLLRRIDGEWERRLQWEEQAQNSIENQAKALSMLAHSLEMSGTELQRLMHGLADEQTFFRNSLERIEKGQAALDKSSAGLMQQLGQFEKAQDAMSQSLEASSAGLMQQLGQFEKAHATLSQSLELSGTSLKQAVEELRKHSSEKMESSTRQVIAAIPNKPIYWSNEFERQVVQDNWGDVTENPDFPIKFKNLISGLDADSAEIIIRILMRQKQYLTKSQKQIDFFTRKEQEELRLLNENFNSEIMKVSDHLYAYKNYLLPVNHFESSVFYYRHGLSQLKTLDRVKGKAIIDVGGFIGDSVLILSELSPSAVYTFESVAENFELLKQTIALNHIPNVVAENVALGAEIGTLTMHVCGSGSTSIDRPGINYREDVTVPVRTLDDYVAEHPMEIGLIKVDIEGGEPNFLAGAKETICAQKPILLLSIYHNAHDFFELKPLLESWNLGYRFSIHKPVYGSATGETLLLAEVP